VAVAYLDSSCLLAVLLGEPGGRRVTAALRRYSRIAASNLLEAEVRAALAREHVVAPSDLFAGVDWVLPDRPLSPEIERVQSVGPLRGADLWHVATALYLDPSVAELVFLTLDRQQQKIAAAVGFATPL